MTNEVTDDYPPQDLRGYEPEVSCQIRGCSRPADWGLASQCGAAPPRYGLFICEEHDDSWPEGETLVFAGEHRRYV